MRTLLIAASVCVIVALLTIWYCRFLHVRDRKWLIPWIVLLSVIGTVVAIVVMDRALPRSETLASPEKDPRELSEVQKYVQGQLLGGRERLSDYSASVRCKEGTNYIQPFSISGADLHKAVDACKVSRVLPVPDEMPKVIESYVVGNKLSDGKMPLNILDMTIRDVINKEIDRRVMVAFFEKNDLAPPFDSISTKIIWDKPAGATVRVVIAGRVSADRIPGVMQSEANDRVFKNTIDQIVRSTYEDVGLRNFRLRIRKIVSQADIQKYFADGVVDASSLTRFLRDGISVEFKEPALAQKVRTVEQQQREFNARQALEAQLLEGYFQKRGLVVPAEKVEVRTAWNPQELEIIVSAKNMEVKPFRQQIPKAPNPKNASAADKKHLDQMTKNIIRVFQLWAGEEMFAKKVGELVSKEDQGEFFDGGKVVTRARLIKYLRERAVQLGLDDVLKSQSQNRPSDPAETRNE